MDVIDDRYYDAGTSIILYGGMAFDSGDSRAAWAIVIAAWSYPLFPLLMALGAWVAFAFRKNRLAAVLTGLTFTPMLLLIISLRL